MKRAATALLVVACAGAPAGAAWDFFGSASAAGGRTDNPRFQSSTVSSNARRSELAAFVRLSGGLRREWVASHLEFFYSPMGTFYEDSDLNDLTHSLGASWDHMFSRRTRISLQEAALFTSEQIVDPNSNVNNNQILTERSRSFYNNFRVTLNHEIDPKNGLTFNFRDTTRYFSADTYVDNLNHQIGAAYRRNLSQRTSISAGYDASYLEFRDGDPNSDPGESTVHTVVGGWSWSAVRGFGTNIAAGYSVLDSTDPGIGSHGALYFNTQLSYSSQRVFSAAGGYSRGFDTGGGAFANSLSQNAYASVRAVFTQRWNSELYFSYNIHNRVENTATAGTERNSVDTFTGRASLNYQFATDWSAGLSYTRFAQSQDVGTAPAAPDIRTNRYYFSLTWSFT